MDGQSETKSKRAFNHAQLMARVGERITLISPGEAAEILGVSTSALAKWRMNGLNGPSFVKLGTKVKYDLETVRAWIESRKRKSTSDTGREAA